MKFIRNKVLSVTVTTIITAITIYLLWQFSGGNNLLKTFKNINPIIAILAFFIYILTLVAKAFRYRFILKNKIGINKLLSIVSIHSFWNNILPFKSGEITYLYMINEEKNISNGENVTSLLLTRVFDVLIILTFLLISGFFIFHKNSNILESVPPTFIISILISGVAILAGTIFYRLKLSKIFSNISFKNSFLNKCSRIISETFLALNQIRDIRRLFIFTTLSFSVWILDTLFIWAILLSAGFHFSIIEAAFVGIFPVLAGLIPINLVGNFGAFEGTVTGGLVLLNISTESAFNLSFILHIQTLLFSSTLFIFALWYRRTFVNQRISLT
ncbi:MAG: lysylphosphatidylglycerol synthase transmembrane domain-containing protein [Candidatus Levybacteria bacterium]|nr:lysylphosphatidylglycerol synthase transmembrane domain-containing protein [Candidatus Levybacteria bacterium]